MIGLAESAAFLALDLGALHLSQQAGSRTDTAVTRCDARRTTTVQYE
jgi:hypothetical protein